MRECAPLNSPVSIFVFEVFPLFVVIFVAKHIEVSLFIAHFELSIVVLEAALVIAFVFEVQQALFGALISGALRVLAAVHSAPEVFVVDCQVLLGLILFLAFAACESSRKCNEITCELVAE